MARRKPAEELPVTIEGLPADQWLSRWCFFYNSAEPDRTPDPGFVRLLMRFHRLAEPDRTPDPEFVRLLMRFHHQNHPRRELSSEELAAYVDHLAVQVRSVRYAIARVAKLEETTWAAVKHAHRQYGRPVIELGREREALREKWKAADALISKDLLRQTTPKKGGRPKGAKNKPKRKNIRGET